jgi:glycerol uptake facilitator-like aquaporin
MRAWRRPSKGLLPADPLVRRLYTDSISLFEGGGVRTLDKTGSLFVPMVAPHVKECAGRLALDRPRLTRTYSSTAFLQEAVNTAILMLVRSIHSRRARSSFCCAQVVFALGDRHHASMPVGLNSLLMIFTVLGIGVSLGHNTAYCMNVRPPASTPAP